MKHATFFDLVALEGGKSVLSLGLSTVLPTFLLVISLSWLASDQSLAPCPDSGFQIIVDL